MAYALYLYKDLGNGLRLEILRKDWTGEATEIRAMGTTPLSLTGLDNKGSDVLEPIIKSTLNIDIKDLGEIDFKELFTSYATRFKVSVKQDGVQVWGGYVTPDSYSQDLEYRTSINIVARDNLGQLDQLDYDFFEKDGSHIIKVADIIEKAQEKIEWAMEPIEWYAQQYVASDGTALKDSYINTKLFAKEDDSDEAQTWWDVLTAILSSLGQQLRYVGNNKSYIVNVADLYEVGNIGGKFAFDYAIGGAASMEITPSWRQLTVKQDFGLIDNAFNYEQKATYFERIVLEAGPNNLALYRNNFFKYVTEAGTVSGSLDIDNPSSNIQSVTQYDGPMFFNNYSITNAKSSGTTYYNALLFDIFRSTGYMYIPFDVASGSNYIFQFKAYDHVHRVVFTEDEETNRQLSPIPHDATSSIFRNVSIRIKVAIQLIVNESILYMQSDGWSSAENIITFDLPDSEDDSSTSELTINILSTPYNGQLRILFYAPELLSDKDKPAPDVYPFNLSPCVVLNDFDLHTALYEDMSKAPGELEVVGVGNEDGNTKESVEITVGEVPSGLGDSITYAGGLFDATVGHKALTGWHRVDNKTGVMHLSEIIGRGFTHHFCAFRNVNDEKTGGTVVSGTVPFTDTSFFAKHFTIDDLVYVVNSATMDMLAGTADVELRQVLPYVHQDNQYEQNEISGGGGTSIGGGTSSTIAWGAPREAKRIYELPEATDEEAKESYIPIDKEGNESAQRFHVSAIMSLADWFTFDEDRQAVRTKFNFYADGSISQLGAGDESGDTGGLSLGSLTNVGAWADAVGDEDVLLYRPKGSSTWGMKRLSEIMVGGGGGGTLYHDQLEHLDYPDQHPIVAIAGLQSALNAKADASALSGYLPLIGGNITGILSVGGNSVWHAGNSNLSTVDWSCRNLISSGTTFAYASLHNISSSDADRYANRPGFYNAAFGWKDKASGASILLYRPDETKQIPIVFCTSNGDHAAISIDANSNDLKIENSKGAINLRGDVNMSSSLVVDGNIVVKGTITQLGG